MTLNPFRRWGRICGVFAVYPEISIAISDPDPARRTHPGAVCMTDRLLWPVVLPLMRRLGLTGWYRCRHFPRLGVGVWLGCCPGGFPAHVSFHLFLLCDSDDDASCMS